ncbi:MAG: nucleotidyltransferase domain-containing protein [Thermoplasmata archaeon]
MIVRLHKDIETMVDRDISTIRNLISSSLTGVESVVLTGSVARGEPSYSVIEGKATLLSDYDTVVVMKNRAALNAISKCGILEATISQALGRKVSIGAVPRFFWKRAPRTAFFYGIKKTGRTICGRDLLGEIPIQKREEIDKEDGLSILFNYLNQLLTVYSQSQSDFFRMRPDGNGSVLLTSSRAILACTEALLILEGKYDPSLNKRIRILREEAGNSILALIRAFPEFPRLLGEAYNVRNGQNGTSPDFRPNPYTFWFKSKECLLEVVRHYLREHFNLTSSENIDLLGNYANIPDRISRNVQYFLLKSISERKFLLSASLWRHPVKRRFQSAAFLLASSLKEKDISERELQCAMVLVDAFFPFRSHIDYPITEDWWNLKTTLATYWRFASPVLGM